MKFSHYLKELGQSLSSIVSCEKAVDLFLNWMKKQSIDPAQGSYGDVMGYVKYCQGNGATQRTIQNYLTMIKHYYDYLLVLNEVEVNPVIGIKIQGVKRKSLYHIFKPEELHALYNNYSDASLKGKRNKVIIGLLIYQGLKTEELSVLEVKDVKIKEGKIEVPGSKTGNARSLLLEPHQVLALYEYILETRPKILIASREKTEKLFVSIEGGADVYTYMTRIMFWLKKQNKLVVNAKQIRASVITKWLKQYNLREVQYLAGHRYISSTEAYKVNEMEGLTEEVNRFHPLG